MINTNVGINIINTWMNALSPTFFTKQNVCAKLFKACKNPFVMSQWSLISRQL